MSTDDQPSDPRTSLPGAIDALARGGELETVLGGVLAAGAAALHPVMGAIFISDPDRPGLAVASGDSGHGFKFAPVLGGVIADAIEDKPSRFTERFAWRMPAARKAESARWGLS